ncbi:MAG: GNAT family N-acetyltransferase [Pseudomonadota bacterium]
MTGTNFVTRRLTRPDLSLLAQAGDDVFDNPVIAAAASAFLEDASHMIVIATDPSRDDRIIGFVSAVRLRHPDKAAPELFVNEIGVAARFRRMGVGGAMMRTLFREARAMGCGLAWLAVDADNAVALSFYRSIGGTPPEEQLHIDFDLSRY